MKLIDAKPLDEFLSIADSVRADIAKAHPDWMSVLREVDALWRTELFGEDLARANAPALFAVWLARDTSSDSRKRFRREFGHAIGPAVTGAWPLGSYLLAIDAV